MPNNELNRTCTASQLIERLKTLIAEHGDLHVYARDADTRYRLPIGLMFRAEQPEEDRPARFEITTDYHNRPRADFDQETKPTAGNPPNGSGL